MPPASGKAAPAVLNSWKEIANYLGRGVRTVQRWEREQGLPVHRVGDGPRSPVFAFIWELRFWLNTTGAQHTSVPHFETMVKPNNGDTGAMQRSLEVSQKLLARSLDLARLVAENTAKQRRQTESLLQTIRALKLRTKSRP